MIFPEALKPGDTVRVVAPSSGFPRNDFFAGLAWLAGRYRVEYGESIVERAAYLAGSDERRFDEMVRAFQADHVKAIVCARGGYGASRFADRLPWGEFKKKPKWIVGFSDITVLHLFANANGIASVHGSNVTGLSRATPWVRHTWMRSLEMPSHRATWKCDVVHRGKGEGALIGGNLALVHAMAAAGQFHFPDGAILVLEDTTEKPYRVDRMLTSLRSGGYLARASAIVFGEFTECSPNVDGRTVSEVIADCTRGSGVPVVSGAPFGHGVLNEAFILGKRASLAEDGSLAIG